MFFSFFCLFSFFSSSLFSLSPTHSGSTDITLPKKAYNAFRDAMFTSQCHRSGSSGEANSTLVGVCVDGDGHKIQKGHASIFTGECYDLSSEQIDQYPELHFRLAGGVELILPPSAYVRGGDMYCDDKNQVTLAIDSGADGGGTILGDVFMQPFMTIFDRVNKRVGFASAEKRC